MHEPIRPIKLIDIIYNRYEGKIYYSSGNVVKKHTSTRKIQ